MSMENFSVKLPVNAAPTGIATFAKCPICADLHSLKADIAILGAPCDIAIQGKPGARLGPRGIRVASTRFRYKSGGSYDPERDTSYLDTDRWTIVDCGDTDYVPGDLDTTFENIRAGVALLVEKGAFPVVLGGDHSITYPVLLGMEKAGPFYVIQIDSHLDWTADVGGQWRSNGSPMRLASQMAHVEKGILHLGIRGIGSSGPKDFADARANGDTIYSVKEMRALGSQKMLEHIPKGARVFVTFDIDGMDYSVTPGTGSPMFGGLFYDETVELLEAIATRFEVVGMDMVEVSPPYDDAANTTCYLAARLISDFLGFVTKRRE